MNGFVLERCDEAETAGQVGNAPLLLQVFIVLCHQYGAGASRLVAYDFAGMSGWFKVV